MKTCAVLVIAAMMASSVTAECPNACSGHGRCTNYLSKSEDYPLQDNKLPDSLLATYGYDTSTPKKDSCTCFSHKDYQGAEVYAWIGADCSLRTCPYGPAHADTPTADDAHAAVIECSGKGTCDRKTGQCKCFAGYTGIGCVRTTCPNNCSNNGQCLSLKKIVDTISDDNANFAAYTTSAFKYDSAFDAEVQYGCMCDSGRRGADCSIAECPSGTDPMGGKGGESGRPCSGRGLCDKGTCKCFTGYFGTKCEMQRGKSA